jgi:hypothetical protein
MGLDGFDPWLESVYFDILTSWKRWGGFEVAFE